ncbi:MAG: NB-ARC domain-containing protein [Candidatus Eisenbacteria bacterium]
MLLDPVTLSIAGLVALVRESGVANAVTDMGQTTIEGVLGNGAYAGLRSQVLQTLSGSAVDRALKRALSSSSAVPTNERLRERFLIAVALHSDFSRLLEAAERGHLPSDDAFVAVLRAADPTLPNPEQVSGELAEALALELSRDEAMLAKILVHMPGQLGRLLGMVEEIREGIRAGQRTALPDRLFAVGVPNPADFVESMTFKNVKSALIQGARQGQIVPIVGMAGSGKSYTAQRLVHDSDIQAEFPWILHVVCSDRAPEEVIEDLAATLRVRDLDLSPTAPPSETRSRIRAWLEDRRGLLVLDDVSADAFAQLVPRGKATTLVTTRDRSLGMLSGVSFVEPVAFDIDEAGHLWSETTGTPITPSDRVLLEELIDAVGGLPLALSVAARMVRHWATATLRSILDALPERGVQSLDDRQRNVAEVLTLAIDGLSPQERSLLQAMAVCAPEGFRVGLVAEVAQLGEEDAMAAFQTLVDRSLARVLAKAPPRGWVHSLVGWVAREGSAASGLSGRHVSVLARRFEGWEERWSELDHDLGDALHAMKSTRFPGTNDDVVLALEAFAFCFRRGWWAAAFELMRGWESAASSKPMLQASYGNQALILRAWGRLEESMLLLKKQESLCEELGDRASLLLCYGNQAVILQAWGRLEEAMSLHKREKSMCEEAGDMAALQACYGNEALILRAWGRLEEAMSLLKKQESLCEELGDKAGLQLSYGNQALILQAWGRLEESMSLLKKQESMCEELGDRAGLQGSYGNQAVVLLAWGGLEESMSLLRKQESLCEELGERAGLLRSYGNQALILRAWGRLEEAMSLHHREELLCQELGDRACLQASYGNQALILKARGRLEEAMSLLKKQESLCEELGDKTGLSRSYGGQALIHEARGRLEEAMNLHKREESLCEELGDKAGLSRTYGNQARILGASGYLEETMTLLENQEALCVELGNKNGLARARANMAALHAHTGDLATACRLATEALGAFRELGMPEETEIAERMVAEFCAERDLGLS